MTPQQHIEAERTSLNTYLSTQHIPLELVRGELGAENLEKILLALAVMEKQMQEGIELAHQGKVEEAAYLFGAGARITKDGIYVVIVESAGGMTKFWSAGPISGVQAVMRDYI